MRSAALTAMLMLATAGSTGPHTRAGNASGYLMPIAMTPRRQPMSRRGSPRRKLNERGGAPGTYATLNGWSHERQTSPGANREARALPGHPGGDPTV